MRLITEVVIMSFLKICLVLIISNTSLQLSAMDPPLNKNFTNILEEQARLIEPGIRILQDKIPAFEPFLARKELKKFKKIFTKKLQQDTVVYDFNETEKFKNIKGFCNGKNMIAINFATMLDEGTNYQIYPDQDVLTGELYLARKKNEKHHNGYKKAFENEIAVLEKLGIFRGVLYFQNRPIIIVDYIPGISLAKIINQIPALLKILITNNFLLKVHEMHNKGIFHRDLNISNILVNIENGLPVVHIIDFSEACLIEKSTPSKAGAIYLLPPEIFNEKTPVHDHSISFYMAAKTMAAILTENDFNKYYTTLGSLIQCEHNTDPVVCPLCSFQLFKTACSDIFDSANPLKSIALYDSLTIIIYALSQTERMARPDNNDIAQVIDMLSVLEKEMLEALTKIMKNQKISNFRHSK